MSAIAIRKPGHVPPRTKPRATQHPGERRSTTRAARDVEESADRIVALTARDEARASSIAPIMRALAAAVESDTSSLGAVIAALEQPEILERLRQEDPLLRARLRGIRAKQRLLQAEGGVVSGQEFADLVGVSRQAIDKRRRAGALIGLSLGKKGYHYPIWQAELASLKPVLHALRDYGPWTQAIFLLTPNRWLDGETPLALLRRGEAKAVIDAAGIYGTQAGTSILPAAAG